MTTREKRWIVLGFVITLALILGLGIWEDREQERKVFDMAPIWTGQASVKG